MIEVNPGDIVSSLPAAGAVVLVLWWRLRRIERALERLEERERKIGDRVLRLEVAAGLGPMPRAPTA